jgi:hypothetical protein
MASPIPVPEYLSAVCRRLTSPKTRSLYSASIPIPLSLTENRYVPILLFAENALVQAGMFLFYPEWEQNPDGFDYATETGSLTEQYVHSNLKGKSTAIWM